LRYILGPEWSASAEMMTGGIASCVLEGPHRLGLQCAAESPLALAVIPAQISREFGTSLPASCIRIQTTARLPATVQTRVEWD
jgi:hypothetical protein